MGAILIILPEEKQQVFAFRTYLLGTNLSDSIDAIVTGNGLCLQCWRQRPWMSLIYIMGTHWNGCIDQTYYSKPHFVVSSGEFNQSLLEHEHRKICNIYMSQKCYKVRFKSINKA